VLQFRENNFRKVSGDPLNTLLKIILMLHSMFRVSDLPTTIPLEGRRPNPGTDFQINIAQSHILNINIAQSQISTTFRNTICQSCNIVYSVF